MTVTLNLKPEVEAGLRAQAQAAGLPVDQFLSRRLETLASGREDREYEVDRSTIVERLRAFEAELKGAGIAHLFLHGSYARGTQNHGSSDVDVIAEFDQSRKISLIGRVHLENRLSDILGLKADLADRKMLLPEVAGAG